MNRNQTLGGGAIMAGLFAILTMIPEPGHVVTLSDGTQAEVVQVYDLVGDEVPECVKMQSLETDQEMIFEVRPWSQGDFSIEDSYIIEVAALDGQCGSLIAELGG